jgi:hypothetical protein
MSPSIAARTPLGLFSAFDFRILAKANFWSIGMAEPTIEYLVSSGTQAQAM